MKHLEELMYSTMTHAKEMIESTKTKEEFLAVTAGLLVVAQETYISYMGKKETAKMFYSIADRLAITKD